MPHTNSNFNLSRKEFYKTYPGMFSFQSGDQLKDGTVDLELYTSEQYQFIVDDNRKFVYQLVPIKQEDDIDMCIARYALSDEYHEIKFKQTDEGVQVESI